MQGEILLKKKKKSTLSENVTPVTSTHICIGQIPHALGQHCWIELSVMMEKFYTCTIQYGSQMWLVSDWDVPPLINKLNFKFNFNWNIFFVASFMGIWKLCLLYFIKKILTSDLENYTTKHLYWFVIFQCSFEVNSEVQIANKCLYEWKKKFLIEIAVCS